MSHDALAPIGVIGHYNLLETIDAAGVGELYRARDTKHGRTVGVRVLPRDSTPDSSGLLAAARAVQVLSHPNAITVFDVGEHDGHVFIVFEFLKGRPLRAEMAGRAVNVRRAVDMTIQMADAVAEAHAAGFLHGGLSPDSIIVTAKGNAKVPAFDLAVQSGLELADGRPRLRDYDSPEEARGQAADDRSDIYSLGAILYEMLTMRKPLHRGAAAPSASNTSVSEELDTIVLRAVAPNPDSRYQSVATFAADLRALAMAPPKGAPYASTFELDEPNPQAAAGTRPSTTVSSVILTTTVILTVLVAILWWLMRS